MRGEMPEIIKGNHSVNSFPFSSSMEYMKYVPTGNLGK